MDILLRGSIPEVKCLHMVLLRCSLILVSLLLNNMHLTLSQVLLSTIQVINKDEMLYLSSQLLNWLIT
jgi:hypothetical protein